MATIKRRALYAFLPHLCLTLGAASAPLRAAAQAVDQAQTFRISAEPGATTAALAPSMATLARSLIAAVPEADRATYLDDLFRLQLVAGEYDQALASLTELHALRSRDPSLPVRTKDIQFQILARARLAQAKRGLDFRTAYSAAFRAQFKQLDDAAAALVIRALYAKLYPVGISLRPPLSENLQQALRLAKDNNVSLADGLRLIRAYQMEENLSAVAGLVNDLAREDDARRYIVADVKVPSPDGGTICALTVRPRLQRPRATLLEFTIYADPEVIMSEARRNASRGYNGVEGVTRGKRCSPDAAVPYEHDGADAALLIDWVSRQPWSDGRVGMFGASYTGFTQWAAAKHLPKALKAMMTAVTNAPGIDSPMENNVFHSFQYPWTFYTTDNKALATEIYSDDARWSKMRRDWYVSGRSFRSLEQIDGRPNPIFDRWIAHPTYDTYWQNMVSFREDFSRIDIPVLTTTGYYDGGERGALYYFREHNRYNPNAKHFLVIGPYSHSTGNRGTIDVFGEHARTLVGLPLDDTALQDFGELRFQWFDYVLKGGPRPAILKDRINYQVTGANAWAHVPTLDAMESKRLRLYLSPGVGSGPNRLFTSPSPGKSMELKVDLADRSDVDRQAPGGLILDSAVDSWNGLKFVSEPLDRPTEISGLFSAHLELTLNKRDFDYSIDLYELTADGKYVQLASPMLQRASYLHDRTSRQLLEPNRPLQLDFESTRLMGRHAAKGSRIVMILAINKQPGFQINYGTGKDVSDETIADAGAPLVIRWSGRSYIDLPVGNQLPRQSASN